MDFHLFADESRVLVVEVGVLDCHLFADESEVLVVEVGVWTFTCLLMRAEYLS